MKRFWRVFKVLMFSLFLIGIYAFTIWLAIRFQGDYRLLVILMTIGMIAVTPKLIEKIKTHPDAEKKKPVKNYLQKEFRMFHQLKNALLFQNQEWKEIF